MCVCRHWNAVIKSSCLLETIVIRAKNSYHERFNSLITHIRNDAISSVYTRRLVLAGLIWQPIDITQLSVLFPNLRTLNLNDSSFQLPLPSTNEERLSDFADWIGRLENISEYNEAPHILALINNSHKFNQLVSLSVSGYTTLEVQAHASWFKHLKNAPALTILKIRNFDIELNDIKVLHENAPLVTTFELESVIFMTAENFDSRLSKSPMIETFSMIYCQNSVSTQMLWAVYFLRNYIHLQNFTLELELEDEDEDEELLEEPAKTMIMALGDKIQSFRSNLEIRGQNELEELNRKYIPLIHLKFSLYQSGTFLFNGNALTRQYNVFRHLQTLEICNFNPDKFQMTKDFVSLKQLTLEYPPKNRIFDIHTLSLDTFLIHQCPDQLESLSVKYIEVTTAMNYNYNKVLGHFKTLKVYNGQVNDTVPEFLSDQCPNLNELGFYMTYFQSTFFNLPSHKMNLLEIATAISMHGYIVINEGDHVYVYSSAHYYSMYYFPDEKDITLYSGVVPFPTKTFGRSTLLEFTCQSIGTLIINGCVAV